jgi:NitT/TauT family transport system substrate-binding protein
MQKARFRRGRRAAVAAVVLASLGTVSACGSSDTQSTEASTSGTATAARSGELKKVTVRMPFAANGGDAPFYYAAKLGYYADEGLDVEIRESGGSAQTVTDVNNGGSDFGEVASPNEMLAVANGQPLTAIATTLGSTTFGFFVHKDSGITSIKQMKGKRVAALAEVKPIMDAALAAAGLSEDDITPVYADATALIPTYLSGKVDSIFSSALLEGAVQQRVPTNVILQSTVGLNPPDFVLIVKKSRLADDPETVRGFVRATLRGWMAARKDPQAAIDALEDEHPEVAGGIAMGTLQATFKYLCSAAQKGGPYGKNAESDWTGAAKALQQFAGLKGSTDGTRFFTNELFEGSDAIDVGDC